MFFVQFCKVRFVCLRRRRALQVGYVQRLGVVYVQFHERLSRLRGSGLRNQGPLV